MGLSIIRVSFYYKYESHDRLLDTLLLKIILIINIFPPYCGWETLGVVVLPQLDHPSSFNFPY